LLTRKRVECELAELADPKRAKNLAWFFKTGKGEYGEGDRFLGIRVPDQRKVALRNVDLPLDEVARLLDSPIHEHRFTALEILVAKYDQADEANRSRIFAFYLRHAARANNWDLVDTSAPYIVGEHLKRRPRKLLDRLAASPNVWKRRIAIVSTLPLIGNGEIDDTFRIAKKLLRDPHDLIHKAMGWALREAGKVSRPALLNFLRNHYSVVPRTTLRYAIERFPATQRKKILAGEFR
jgi:3-methyladenine DNA glycosylase AlkD